jgi:hypothetical protein
MIFSNGFCARCLLDRGAYNAIDSVQWRFIGNNHTCLFLSYYIIVCQDMLVQQTSKLQNRRPLFDVELYLAHHAQIICLNSIHRGSVVARFISAIPNG